MTTPSVVLNSSGKNNNKKNNISKIVATFVYASRQWQRTHSARTNINILGHNSHWSTLNQ